MCFSKKFRGLFAPSPGGCAGFGKKKERFRVSGGASHAGDPQGHWRSFGHGTLWALEGVRRASNSGGHLLQGKHFGVGKISIFFEFFWAKLSSLEGEILEQQFLCLDYVAECSRLQSSWLLPITWSLENIAKPGTVALFRLSTIQRCARTIHKKFWALEQISNARISTSSRWLFRPSSMKQIIYSRGKRQVSMFFANCSHGDTATIVDWGSKIVSVQRIQPNLSGFEMLLRFQVGTSDPLSNSVELAPESSLPTVCEEPLRRFFVAFLDSLIFLPTLS